MTAIRKASSYSKRYARPYTRKSKVKAKSYIKTIPPQKIVKFFMGNREAFEQGKLPIVLSMISEEQVQIRDNSLEACRQYINKQLETAFGAQFYFLVKVAPHHILRENKMLTGAGADRMQTGMQLSFGKAIGRAALVPPKKEIFTVAIENERAASETRKFLEKIKAKLPGRTRIITQRIAVSPVVKAQQPA